MANAEGNNGRFIYVEPNNMYSGMTNNAIPFPYEDYCMSVDLQVIIPSREACGMPGATVQDVLNYSSKHGTLSFMHGTDGYLTANYTDISYVNPENNTRECLGIESIQISYNSWFYPQVEIHFVDVRGGSLFGPQEQAYDRQVAFDDEQRSKNSSYTNSYVEGGSFYKALFSFPYPLFKLKVKGFYGRTATFNLAVEDFRGEFNSSTGNFDIVVKFIGYMYGAMADVPFSFLAVAPYMRYAESDEYWRNEPSFVYDDDINRRMHTYPELRLDFTRAAYESETQENLAGAKKNHKSIESKKQDLMGLKSDIVSYLANSLVADDKNKPSYVLVNRDGKNMVYVVYDRNFILYLDKNEYENSREPNKKDISGYNAYKDIINSINSTHSMSLDSNLGFSGDKELKSKYNFTLIKSSDVNQLPPSGIEKVNIMFGNEQKPFGHEDLAGLITNVISSYWRGMNNNQEIKFYVYSFNLGNVIAEIDEALDKADKDGKKLAEEISVTRTLEIAKVLGFRTTIGNAFKLAFAHMDTFATAFYTCLSNIYSQIQNPDYPDRKLSSFKGGLDVANSDLGKAWKKNSDLPLPPFPAFYASTEGDGLSAGGQGVAPTSKKTLVWIGDYKDDLEEVKFVQSLVDATLNYVNDEKRVTEEAQKIKDEADKREKYLDERSQGEFVRLTPHDFAYQNTNPYGLSEVGGATVGNIYSLFALRFFYWLISYNKESKTDESQATLNRNSIEMFAMYEAVNVFNAIPEYIEEVRKMCEDGAPKFMSYITEFTQDRVYNAEVGFCGNPMFSVVGENNLQYTWSGSKYLPVGISTPSRVHETNPGENLITLASTMNDVFYKGRYSFTDLDTSCDVKTAASESRDIGEHKRDDRKCRQTYNEMYRLDVSKSRVFENTYFNGCIFSDKISDVKAVESSIDTSFHDGEGADGLDIINGIRAAKGMAETKRKEMVKFKVFVDNRDFGISSPSVIVLDPEKRTYVSTFANDLYDAQTDIHMKAYLFLLGSGYRTDVSQKKYKSFRLYLPLLIQGAYYYRKLQAQDPLKHPNNAKYKRWSTKQIPVSKAKLENKKYRWGEIDGDKTGNGIQTSLFILEGKDSKEDYITYADLLKMDSLGLGFQSREFENDNGNALYLVDLFKTWVREKFGVIDGYIKNTDYYDDKGTEVVESSILGTGKKVSLKENHEHVGVKAIMDTLFGILHAYNIQDINDEFRTSNGEIQVSKGDFESAFSTFSSTLKKLYDDAGAEVVTKETEKPTTNEIIMSASKDMYISTYMILKNLYDKWFCGMPVSRWKLSDNNCEFNSFKFIDSKYYNVKHVLPCDFNKMCEIASRYSANTNASENNVDASHSFYELLSETARLQEMVMLALPTGNRLAKSGTEYTKAFEEVSDLFTPFAYNKSISDEDSSTYICLYPHKPSEHLDLGDTSYSDDGFNIANSRGLLSRETIPEVFANTNDDTFLIPSFGVTFAKQNQSFFKNIKIGMSNPQVTESSLLAKMVIASRATEGPSQVTIFGQDLYRIYVNNSYTCSVEMMGDLQIAPLMYFQLNNIPMFRGVYQIIKVDHSVTPGDVKTTFTGVRVNRYNVPFATSIAGFTESDWKAVTNAMGENGNTGIDRDFSGIAASNGENIPKNTWLSGNAKNGDKRAIEELNVFKSEIKYIYDELEEFEKNTSFYQECLAKASPKHFHKNRSNDGKSVNAYGRQTTQEIEENLDFLIGYLDNIQDAWGAYCVKNSIEKCINITVSGGYRTPDVNANTAGASKTSAHLRGLAADLQILGRGNKVVDTTLFFEFLAAYLTLHKNDDMGKFDQLLLERNNSGSQWCHFSPKYDKAGTLRRRMIHLLHATNGTQGVL